MSNSIDTYHPAPNSRTIARNRGLSHLCRTNGFTLIEVQIAIVIFVLGMLTFLGYTRVNGTLIASAEDARSVDGYADIAAERAIVVIASESRTTMRPACDIRLEDIDSTGLYPIVEVTATRATP